MKTKIIPVIIAAVVIIGLAGGLYYYLKPKATPQPEGNNSGQTAVQDENQVRELVSDFGNRLKNVSLQASPNDVARAMDENYGGLVDPALLSQWKSDPAKALGRQVSSPWPDRIEISNIKNISPDRYAVQGRVIEITSTEVGTDKAADRYDIKLTVERKNSGWIITAVTASPVNSISQEKTYTSDNEFSLRYPADFKVQTGEGLGGEFLDKSIVKIAFPENAFKDEKDKTNYNEAYVVISKSDKPSIVSGCTSFSDIPNPMNSEIGTKTINGAEFKTESTSDAAAGNIYDSNLYRTVHNGVCYEISLTIHTGNIHNYEPPVKEFDKTKALGPLEKILDSFTFLK